MFPNITQFEEIAYDTETTGLSPQGGARVFGFSISTPDGMDYYWDIRTTPLAVKWFNDQMKKYKGKIVCHNLSFDYRLSKATGILFPLDNAWDTVILASLINEHEMSYSLDNLAGKYTDCPKQGDQLYKDMAAIFGGRATRNVQMKNISNAPIEIVSPYAKADTRSTLALFQYQKDQIKKQKLEKIVDFERQITPHIIRSEEHGVRVDIPAAEKAVGKLSKEIAIAQAKLDDIAGFPCNPQPSGDIKKLFKPEWRNQQWFAIDGTPLKETDSGNASIGTEALMSMSHPAAAAILDLRGLLKTRDTFLVGHVLESAYGGRVYPGINQLKGDNGGTGTGRLSYVAPALQQIPDRNKKVAEIVKSVFLPDEGHKWVDADKASFEVRIFAHLVGTPDITQKYVDDPETDFHQYVSDLTNLVRNATYSGQPNAKQLNLSMIFNQGDGTTAEKMGMPWTWESFVPTDSKDGKEITYKKPGPEAKKVIEKYHRALPGVKKLAEGCKQTASNRGYLFTRRGRHLRFPMRHKVYKASGILIQSTSADENKYTWLKVAEALEGYDARMLLNTHDSYSMSMPEDQAEEICKKVKSRVEEDRGLRVPLILEVNHPGDTWWDSKNSKRWL